MDNPWGELLKLSWHESLDKAAKLVDDAEGPVDIIAFGMAFVMGSQRLDVTEVELRACLDAMIDVWKQAGGRFKP